MKDDYPRGAPKGEEYECLSTVDFDGFPMHGHCSCYDNGKPDRLKKPTMRIYECCECEAERRRPKLIKCKE